jgi:hypothetical protein
MTRLPRRSRTLAAAAALVLAAGLTACADDEPVAEDPGGDETTSAAGDPSEEPTDPAPSDPGTSTPGTVAVPVYFTGETPQGPRLYREFRQVEADNPMEEAIALMTAGDALDPDYGTLYPGGSFDSVAVEGDVIVATVPDDGWTTAAGGMDTEDAWLAVQQLVYTVQGIQQERLPVLVQLGSGPATLFGVDTAGGVKAAEPLEVLAFMSVTQPEEGEAVSGTFTAEGIGSSFEATVLWEVRDESGAAVLEGFTTAEGFMDKLYPWATEVDVSGLAPGTYSFVALTDDPSGGEGPGPTEDSKTIIVE